MKQKKACRYSYERVSTTTKKKKKKEAKRTVHACTIAKSNKNWMNWMKFLESSESSKYRVYISPYLLSRTRNKCNKPAIQDDFHILHNLNVGLYPIHEPDASNSLVYSWVLLSQFLYGNHTEFRNIISYAETLGNGLQ